MTSVSPELPVFLVVEFSSVEPSRGDEEGQGLTKTTTKGVPLEHICLEADAILILAQVEKAFHSFPLPEMVMRPEVQALMQRTIFFSGNLLPVLSIVRNNVSKCD
ncbi:hypothetical protein WISP_118043 [Willisornis vidua]|uniref:Uncharacterized protein n=1 Tax=Willisornis vidua TaxID=1566151 RepID=A0ABQ9CT92_9PASS|nr:hypothetical protein WISP_118043 [Willisornis vidua]